MHRISIQALVILAAVASSLWLACSGGRACESTESITTICGFNHPEDLALLPGGDWLLVSEFGKLGSKRPGALKLFAIDGGEIEHLYPSARADADGSRAPAWGDPNCPGPPAESFSPHGIHLDPDGRVLAVNHGGRESIEFFALEVSGRGLPSIEWRGCAVVPEGLWLNDVAGLPRGGFVATHMMSRSAEADLARTGAAPDEKGYVVAWQPGRGWGEVPGSRGSLPNGISASEDGSILYVNYTGSGQVVAIERATGVDLWSAPVISPDNSSWARDGRLLVASLRSPLAAVLGCIAADPPYCGVSFAIVSIDPRDGSTEILFEGGGAPFGGATVAVQVENALYLGSFTGNRIARVKASPSKR